MELERLHPHDIEWAWPLVSGWITEAVERSAGRHSVETVVSAILNDMYHLWVVVDPDRDNEVRAVVVTQFLQYPTGLLAADIIIATGKQRKEWVGLLPTLEQWAKDNGCDLFQMYARKGWAREFKDSHTLSHVLLERRL